MSLRLTDSLASTSALRAVCDDTALLGAMLQFEVALAQAEATAGVIPPVEAHRDGDRGEHPSRGGASRRRPR